MRSAALLASLGIAGLFLACGNDPPPAVPQPPPVVQMPPENISGQPPAPTGVDKTAIDPNTAPCDDFYQYACGGWTKATQIPADESSWSRSFSVIHERNEEILHQILEAYAKGEKQDEPYAKALGDFYGSCMDEAAIEAARLSPLDPWLKAIDGVKDAASLTKLLGRFQSELGTGVVFDMQAAQDFSDATQVLGLFWQSGLGMPEKEYYTVNEGKMAELRTKYEAHVGAMFALAGEPEAKAKANATKVLAIEKQLADAWMSKEERREPKKIAHRATKAELAKTAPGIQWDAWLDGAKAKNVAVFNVSQPEFLKAVGAMLGGKVAVADWKTYLRWHVLRIHGNELSKKFVDEKFKWRQALTGADKLPERWKRCVRTVDASMGEALAQPFVKQTLGSEGKANVVAMVQVIEKAMHANIETIAWMDDATRKAAFTKLGKIANKIAYPDKWRDYSKLEITRKSYVENSQKASAFEYARQVAKIGKPVDRAEWQMSPPTVNAYYDPQLNEMVFPAGILQPPFYSNSLPRPTNYGGIGMVMGHELTHGFDDEGRQYDAEGNLKDWWAPNVNTEFVRRASCVKKQFDDYTVLNDVHVNGALTLGENIADLGGIKLAYKALMSLPPAPPGGKPEFTPQQELFLGFAQSWCSKMRDEQLLTLVKTNPHSPPMFRVNGPLSNLPEFAQAFSCKADAKMVRKDRCEVW
ncbi:MAG: M13 family metallopeptidase [Labilithrix sp.]|nr:M13 family metallopeptidase [Labilithrix sp.]MCW5812221.1 M13 family metallopeptidase [Labilithrix sp.]